MTFGVMPSFEEFSASFNSNITQGFLSIRSGAGKPAPVAGDFSAEETFDIVQKLAESGDEEKESFASSIMYVVGFEWI